MYLQPEETAALSGLATSVREHCVRMAQNGGCFLGASLSCVDILTLLYTKVLRVDPANPGDSNRDYFLLSKGHDVPALYGLFAELGIIGKERLATHLKPGSNIYWHPNRKVPGVEFHSGSLGHLLSVGAGIAYNSKFEKKKNHVYVLLGDGELNEGSIWETCLVSKAHKLDNLTAIIDRNQFQANTRTESLIPLEPLDKKFEAFGWYVHSCNGHDFNDMYEVIQQAGHNSGAPTAIICDTIRGKGLPSIEARADRWFCNFTEDEISALLEELHTQKQSILTSETLMVR